MKARPGDLALCSEDGCIGLVQTTLENGLVVGVTRRGRHWQARDPVVVARPCLICGGSGGRPGYDGEACRSCSGAGGTLTPGAFSAISRGFTTRMGG